MEYKVISFYRYRSVNKPEKLKVKLQAFCEKHGILGRILLGSEGINGACSGTSTAVREVKRFLRKIFPQLTFREQSVKTNAYHKLVVRVRKEIVVFGKLVDPKKRASYVTPKALKNMLDKKADVVLLDARNDYESSVGKFKNAVVLPIRNFREFPEAAKKLRHIKNKKIVMYCTGGIRCEKASAYMKEQGFKGVRHLKGGIVDYLKYFDTHWEGSCFVFDDRLVMPTVKPITVCTHCNKPTAAYINCHNLDCDVLFICCSGCQEKVKSCCSMVCRKSPRQRRVVEKKYTLVGYVENYYGKPRVVQVKVAKRVSKRMVVGFKGKHTAVSGCTISEMRNAVGEKIITAKPGMVVTFPVQEKVRKNDQVVIYDDTY